jgi:AcrR family transcriptional regulator
LEPSRDTSERAAATGSRILDAAERAFARTGLAGTRVREIAQAAGVNAATLYLYYPSKQALYQAVLDRGFRPIVELVERFDSAPAERRAAVERLVGEVLRHLAARPHLSRLIYLEAISEGELLPHLARTWFRPLVERIGLHVKSAPNLCGWEETQLPLVTAAVLNVVFGHFALAPLLAEVLDRDPLAPESLQEQTRLVTELLLRVFQGFHEEDLR